MEIKVRARLPRLKILVPISWLIGLFRPIRKKIPSQLTFGKVWTDHMFMMKYTEEKRWFNPIIKPYGPISLPPGAMVFHYGQEIFEGMKAYYHGPGKFALFRPEDNIARFNRSAERMVMPQVDPDLFLEALIQLIKLDYRWIPTKPDHALYIRPFMIATEEQLGVRSSKEYLFLIILSPVGPYFGSLNPVKIYVSDIYSRACEGGVGEAKTGGNYAASLYAAKVAAQKGCSQVLWLDAKNHQWIEEVGAMNIFFVDDGTTLITPPLTGTILPGITRDTILKLAPSLGLRALEMPLDIERTLKFIKEGVITEVFGSGTAAVVAPIGELHYKDEIHVVNNQSGPVVKKIYEELTAIQYGKKENPFGWTKIFNA